MGAQVGFSAGVPQLFITAPLKTAPGTLVDIPLRRIAFVSPTVVTAVVPDCSGLSATPSLYALGGSSGTADLSSVEVGGYAQGGIRYLSGEELFRAFVYVAGGLPTTASTTPVRSIERLTY